MYLGIEVSKATRQACLRNAAGQSKTQVGDNSRPGIALWLAWAVRHGAPAAPGHAVMAAAGVSPEGAASALVAAAVTGSLGNPAHAQAFARGFAGRTTTDGRDGHVRARCGACLQPPAWQPPAPAVRAVPALRARRAAVAQARRRDPKRREQALATATSVRVHPSIDDPIAFLKQERARLPQAINDPSDRHPG